MKKYTLIAGLLVINIAFGSDLCGMLHDKSQKILEFIQKTHEPMESVKYKDIFSEESDLLDVEKHIHGALKNRSVLWLIIQKILEVKEFGLQQDIKHDLKMVKTLLENHSFKINERNYFFTIKKDMFGRKCVQVQEGSLLHMVAQCGNPKLMRMILAKTPELDVQNEDGLPAIFFSVAQNHEEATRLLVDAGANTDVRVAKKSWVCCCGPTRVPLGACTSNENIKKLLEAIRTTT